ncbi:DUF2179 domain-containing protein, partial [Enterococcus faecalis]|uniref:DUF2179 domain-containing protein n=1 Tax=Enterococcus faecalis TaxID=1351 RepID=UPI003D6B771C
LTRYELYDFEQAVYRLDEHAFVNILPTQSVFGRFANEDEQRIFHSTGPFPELQSYTVQRYPPTKKLN